MRTGTLSIQVIFGQERRLLVPLYQRPYVWKQDLQWQPLWDDIRSIADRLLADKPIRPHFLGAIVLDQVTTPTGDVENRMVIDGQQRLATIQIILEAFSDICAALGATRYHKALVKLTRNDDPLSDDPDDQYKVWPTNVDRDQFRRVMQASSPEELHPEKLPWPHLIADAYVFFHQAMHAWLTAAPGDLESRIEVLFNTLRQQTRMVVIDLDKEDDAQLIFETLNARGTPLLPSDLVKNFLLRRAELEKEDINTLYELYWKGFDLSPAYWRQELGPGHAKRARIDLFLQFYLTLKKADEVPVAQLYTSFREYAKNTQSASAHLESLHRYAEIYHAFDTGTPDTPLGRFRRRLGQLDITTAYPFLLELFAQYGSDSPQVLPVLADLESFLVRRLVCQLTTRSYNRLFIDLLATIPGDPNSLTARVRAKLLESDSAATRWPPDAEFRQAWLDAPLYERLQRQRIRMLLEALELSKYTKLTEAIKLPDRLTIEHVLPQGWQQHWPLPTDLPAPEAEARRRQLIHTLGNLTLVTQPLNSAESNLPWAQKVPLLQRSSALALNRELSAYTSWGEPELLDRGASLFAFACKLWPYPQP